MAMMYDYEIRAYQNRIIVIRSRASDSYYDYTTNTYIYRTSYDVFILIENNYEISVIDILKFGITGSDYYRYVKINTSPQLTKLHYEYIPFGSSVPTVVIKNIDYITLYVYDVSFIDQNKYVEMVYNSNQTNITLSYPPYQSNPSSNNIFFLL